MPPYRHKPVTKRDPLPVHELLAIGETLEPDWAVDAACSEVGGDWWHPEKGDSNRPARSVCARCAVAVECLAFALVHREQFGIYGGLSAKERRPLLRLIDAGHVEAA